MLPSCPPVCISSRDGRLRNLLSIATAKFLALKVQASYLRLHLLVACVSTYFFFVWLLFKPLFFDVIEIEDKLRIHVFLVGGRQRISKLAFI
jgi:hypothetical protein